MTKKEIEDKLRELFKGKYNGDLFVEVRCRVYAFQKSIEFYEKTYDNQTDLLDDAYRFLYQSIDPEFIMFLAKKEDMEIFEYANTLLHQYDKDYDSKKKEAK